MWPQKLLDGKPFVVIPSIMAKQGVMAGSQGAIYYPADELRKSARMWDGRFAVLAHPDIYPSGGRAGHPQVITDRAIGYVFNTRFDDRTKALKAEVWVDPDKLGRLNPALLRKVKAGQPIEVSTGLFMDREPATGSYDGKPYTSIGRNYRPDHLAVLVDSVGACSCTAGCGCGVLNSSARRDPLTVILNRFAAEERERLARRFIRPATPTAPTQRAVPLGVFRRERLINPNDFSMPAGWLPTTAPKPGTKVVA